MVAAIVRGRRRVHPSIARRAGGVARARSRAGLALVATASCATLALGCGGGSEQTAGERAGTYDVQIVRASFPLKQAIAKPTVLELQVRNAGSHPLPAVAVALDSLNYTENFPNLAANKRPVWVVEQGPGKPAKPQAESQEVNPPGAGQTAYVNTWALGALAPGHTQTFRWKLVPVKAGAHTVNYSIFAGLAGKARAQLASGAKAQGSFAVKIAPAPALSHVDPATGRITLGPSPSAP